MAKKKKQTSTNDDDDDAYYRFDADDGPRNSNRIPFSSANSKEPSAWNTKILNWFNSQSGTRLSGMALLSVTVLVYSLLVLLATRRNKRSSKKLKKHVDEGREGFELSDLAEADRMLYASLSYVRCDDAGVPIMVTKESLIVRNRLPENVDQFPDLEASTHTDYVSLTDKPIAKPCSETSSSTESIYIEDEEPDTGPFDPAMVVDLSDIFPDSNTV
jgi:hypothetical protein